MIKLNKYSNKQISKASKEMIEIMKYAPIEILRNYPYEYRIFFSKFADRNYNWKYDTNKKLYEQDMSKLTQRLLIYMKNNVFNN